MNNFKMSSLETKPNLSEKRGTFSIRSSSLQKLKCSATYQFHLAGSKLSKESLTQLFEKLITRSRTLLQVAFVALALPTFNLLTMVTLWSLDVFAKSVGLNLVIENESTAKLQSSENKKFFVRIRRNDKSSETPIQKTDELENRLKPEVPEPLPFANLRIRNKVKRNGFLSICVYSCTAFAYVQFVILVLAITSFSTPPGLIFLSLSLFLIGYIVYQILLTSKPKQSEPIFTSKPTAPERFRISRSSTRRYLEFHEKTLSKIKLI